MKSIYLTVCFPDAGMAEPQSGLRATPGRRTELPARAHRPEALRSLRRAQDMDKTVSGGLYVRMAIAGTASVLEWLSDSWDCVQHPATALSCERALISLRHSAQFATRRIWTRL